ncbi:hypothetical protein [Curtobacterium sp. MCPF17_031]|uniref:hypothetical protein n=1 Tax=Curtobacterium sp. MCPF17_031 TaxID=2175653 RepID=UPI0011B3FA22|nr:hypothetical protein [Curtobacterium sp. MCPF17_031]
MGENLLPAHLERWWTQRQPLPNGLLVGLDGSLVDRDRIVPRYTRVSGVLRDPGSVKDHRSESEVDRGRLAYSPELRRLAGVTQVVSPNLETANMHSRGSHSYKVAQSHERSPNTSRGEQSLTRVLRMWS